MIWISGRPYNFDYINKCFVFLSQRCLAYFRQISTTKQIFFLYKQYYLLLTGYLKIKKKIYVNILLHYINQLTISCVSLDTKLPEKYKIQIYYVVDIFRIDDNILYHLFGILMAYTYVQHWFQSYCTNRGANVRIEMTYAYSIMYKSTKHQRVLLISYPYIILNSWLLRQGFERVRNDSNFLREITQTHK